MIAVDEPLNCPNVSGVACKYAGIFQEFLQHSELPIWNRLNNTGFWRQLTVSFSNYQCDYSNFFWPSIIVIIYYRIT